MNRTSLLFQVGCFLAAVLWLGACQAFTPTPIIPSPSPEHTSQAIPETPIPALRKTATATLLPTPTRAIQVVTSELRGTTVTFWHPFGDGDAQALEALVNQFNEQNTWGIEVNAEAYPGFGALEEAFRAAQQTGAPPDLVIGYPDQALRWDRDGDSLVDLNLYIQDSEWNLSREVMESYPDAIWEENQHTAAGENKRLGLPWYRSGMVLAYNQAWALSLDYKEPPETVRTFQSQACAASLALKADGLVENDGRGGWLVSTNPGILVSWLYAFRSEFISPDGSTYTLNTSQSSEAIATFSQATRGKCFWADETVSPVEAFTTKQALFVTVSLPGLAEFSKQLEESGFEDRWTVMALPDIDGNPVVDLYGPAFLIPVSSTERQLAAWAFVRWMSAADRQAEWAVKTGYFPASTAPLAMLRANSPTQPVQWREALALLPQARGEPAKASWGSVRWAMGEALAQLLSPGLRAGDLQLILASLEQLARDLDYQIP